MPIYEFKCNNGHLFDRFLKLANYNDPQTCECGAASVKLLSRPAIHADFPPYESPVTGKMITSRRERREDLARSGCVEYEPSMLQESERKRAAEDAALEKKIDEHVEAEIINMDARTREKLVSELQSGVDVEVVRM